MLVKNYLSIKEGSFKLSTLLLILSLFACNNFAQPIQPKGVAASDDELLATLAFLAKQGINAICSIETLEKYLDINIQGLRLDLRSQEKSTSNFTKDEYSDSITSKQTGPILGFSMFSRELTSNSELACRLVISFKNEKICDRASQKVKKIMKTDLVSTNLIHGSGVSYIYEFQSNDDEKSFLQLGTSQNSCANGFVLSTKGVFK